MDCSKDVLYQSSLGFLVLTLETSRTDYEKNGNKVGVHATEFDYSNNPCGTVTRINMDGTSMLDNFERPIIENVTCGRGHVSEHPFDQ